MSSKASRESDHLVKDAVIIQRFVHDLMMYTLPKCGFPETSLPTTELKENIYNRANFLEIAGVCTLRVSLAMRDRWVRMFQSRRKSSGFTKENVLIFLEKIAVCCPLSYLNTTQSIVNATLSLCNEIILFFHREDIGIDLGVVMDSTSAYITRVMQINPFITVRIEDLFDKFDNISWYAAWITDLIKSFAVPYGSRGDVSELFFEHVKMQWKFFEETTFTEKPSVREMRGYLGFLPDDLFEVITSEDLPEDAELATETMPQDARESPKPRGSSESDVAGGNESSESVGAVEQAAKDEQSSKNSPELAIEDTLEGLNLGAEGGALENQIETPQRKRSKRKKSRKKK